MLLRLAYLGITNAFALLRRLPGADRDKDIEILALRHQLAHGLVEMADRGQTFPLRHQRIRIESVAFRFHRPAGTGFVQPV